MQAWLMMFAITSPLLDTGRFIEWPRFMYPNAPLKCGIPLDYPKQAKILLKAF